MFNPISPPRASISLTNWALAGPPMDRVAGHQSNIIHTQSIRRVEQPMRRCCQRGSGPHVLLPQRSHHNHRPGSISFFPYLPMQKSAKIRSITSVRMAFPVISSIHDTAPHVSTAIPSIGCLFLTPSIRPARAQERLLSPAPA